MRISDWSSDVCSSDLLGAVGGDVVEMPRAIGLALVPRPLGRERDEFPAPVENAARAVMLEEERRVALDLLPLEHAGDRDAVDRQIGRASCRERVCQYV